MAKKISVFIKEPGKKPRHVNISDSLENLQRTVGGYIETVTLATDLVIICDEEGRLRGKEHCCSVRGVDFVGTVIFCGISGDRFDDVPLSFKDFKNFFPKLFSDTTAVVSAKADGLIQRRML